MHEIQPQTTLRRARRSARGRTAGSLMGDLSQVASRLHEALQRSDITVWTNPDAQIFFDAPESCPSIDSHRLVGTYGVGASPCDIEADLSAMRNESIPVSMIVD